MPNHIAVEARRICSRAARVAALLLMAGTASAFAADLRVLTAGAVKSLVVAMAPEIEREGGRRLDVGTDTAGGLVRRAQGGERFDVIVATRAGIDELERAGKVVAGSAVPVARVGIGIAVPAGAPTPDISTADGFRQALLGARAVAYIDPAAGGSSGIYLAGLFERLGVAPAIAAKAVLVPGGLVAERLVDGRADLALQQLSELMSVPGVRVLGPIPAELQNETVYVGAVGASSDDAPAARAMLARLRGPAADASRRERGMAPP